MENLIEQWKKDELALFKGWNFSYIKNRCIEKQPPWNYNGFAKNLVKKSKSILDVATGGGEIFSSFAPFHGNVIAIEGYKPNIAVAKKNLSSLGVKVIESEDTRIWPFKREEFDLVLNRHGGINISETYRVVENNGVFLTQQVGGDNFIDLMAEFNTKPKWTENELEIVVEKMEEIGFGIKEAKKWRGKRIFKDVGAIVYLLKAVPWIVDDFSVDSHLSYLEKLQKKLEKNGKLEFIDTKFFILGVKK